MENVRLYEIKIQQLESKIKSLEKDLKLKDAQLGSYKDEVRKWNEKYKELKKTITNG